MRCYRTKPNKKMQNKGENFLILKGLICTITISFLVTIIKGDESSDIVSFSSFIRGIDPANVIGIDWNNGVAPNPCLHHWKGVKCDVEGTRIIAIRLDNLGLGGEIDGNSLCNLQNLKFLNLARNRIKGEIPNSILNCTSLRYLNLSSNLLYGSVPIGLSMFRHLKTLDISNNNFEVIFWLSKQELINSSNDSAGPSASQERDMQNGRNNIFFEKWKSWVPFVIGTVFLMMLIIYVNIKSRKLSKEKDILRSLEKSSIEIPQEKDIEEVEAEEIRSNLVFFVEEKERFKMVDLLETAAYLQKQGLCSNLYKVQLKNNEAFAVKRLKKLIVSVDDFGENMTRIGNLNHANILPLVGFNCTNEEKVLIYRYQKKGSLLTLQENHSEGKRKFPWKLRLSIAVGIARGLNFIYQSFNNEEEMIPHGNIKPSNIVLNENEEPLISEYGYSKFLDPKTAFLFNSNGYTCPEKALSQEADVYSFGVILLELLTGKMVDKSGLDLPKWVKSMVREEWTGEVFDKELRKFEMFSFSLLNISLKCVAHFPENRPSFAKILEKMEEVVSAYHDFTSSPTSSVEFSG